MGHIYTRTGDKGNCDVIGKRVAKDNMVIELLGDLDELNSFLGLAKAHQSDSELKSDLEKIQKCLIPIMGEVAGGKSADFLVDVFCLEALCDKYCKGELREFKVPGENVESAYLDVARAVARRAERRAVTVIGEGAILPWLNRLSDVLFAMARFTE